MQTPRRTSVAIAAVAASSLLLTACGSGSDSGSSDSGGGGAAAGGPVELSVALFGTFGFDEVGLFEEYERLNPGVTIRYESTQGETNYWPALQTRLASGSGVADVQGIEVARIADVTTNQPDLWTDLRETPAADALDGYVEWKSAAATTEDGAVLGLGTDIGPMGICYRTDLLQAAGLPTDPTELSARMQTWDDFLALGREFQANAPAGAAWHDSAGGLFNAIISQEETLYSDASGEPVYDTNPVIRAAFDQAAQAGQNGLTAKLEQFLDPAWDQGFASGSFATIACPSWMVGYIKGKAGDAGAGLWNVTTLPNGEGGNWGGSYLGIPAVSEHKEEAGELIAWLTAPEQQAKVFTEVGNFPSRTEAIESVSATTDEYFSGAPIGQIFSESAESAPVQTMGPNDGAMEEAIVQALLSVETAGTSPEEAWNNAVTEIQNQIG
ncbi:extracellular solute-binding protein [Pseudonocardia nigra]|uniref:extracellular solute-binding protein n=1 Tax=Pseudonocardia nigra TaxID=1921578 RepID=UPI001C5D9D3D|nr:extracellular solute-binding protein [Pseudonocardia nigra]